MSAICQIKDIELVPMHAALPSEMPAEDMSYSKAKVALVAFLILPYMAIWTVLLVVCLPVKLLNICREKQIDAVNAFYQEYVDTVALTVRYFCAEKCHFTPGTGRPILLVHGYLHDTSGWYAQMDHLKEQGLGPVYSIDLGDGSFASKFWSMRRYATQVQQKVQEIAQETGRHDIALVGHSMGGVVISMAADENVRDVVTIGSPLHGSPVANCLGIGPNGREMHTDSPLLTEVQESIAEKSTHTRFRHIASACDQTVPWHSAIMGTDPETNFIFPDLGHASLVTAKKVAAKVADWLKPAA